MTPYTMDNLAQSMKGLQVSSSVDSLCEMMGETKVKYDEVKELSYFVNLKRVTESDIFATDERYRRYLRNILCWTIDGVSYNCVREWIITYLATSDKLEKVNLMCLIDYELYSIVCKTVNNV